MSQAPLSLAVPGADASEDRIMHQILCSVEENAAISQRQLSQDIGIALGSVNWYLKRCIKKGLIKMSQVPLKRYAYFLTPKGFEEKSRLTAKYLKWSFNFFRRGRDQANDLLQKCMDQGWSSVLLAGSGDLAEIFVLSALEKPVHLVAVLGSAEKKDRLAGIPVVKSYSEIRDDFQAIILTDLEAPAESYREALRQMEARGLDVKNILIPKILHFNPIFGETVKNGRKK